MNRRGFLRTLVAAIAGAVVAPHLALSNTPTPLFTEFVPTGAVGDFSIVYYFQGELLCDNPRASFIITDIEE